MRSAPSVPCHCGAFRLPLKVASASSVPWMRQPGGASADHTPTSGRRARSRAFRGVSGDQVQPPSWRVSVLLALASAWPARSLSHCRRARTWLPSAFNSSRAWRTPAAVPLTGEVALLLVAALD